MGVRDVSATDPQFQRAASKTAMDLVVGQLAKISAKNGYSHDVLDIVRQQWRSARPPYGTIVLYFQSIADDQENLEQGFAYTQLRYGAVWALQRHKDNVPRDESLLAAAEDLRRTLLQSGWLPEYVWLSNLDITSLHEDSPSEAFFGLSFDLELSYRTRHDQTEVFDTPWK